jgi:serine/threonine-protein kinase
LQEAAPIVAQLCQGLSLAHAAGIVHRDIKPSNLFLARAGAIEVLKILDFGIAKLTALTKPHEGNSTRSGVMIGSPRYMSPEQMQGKLVDARSDLWSVAVVIFEMVTGVSPFDREHLGAIVSAVCAEPAPVPSDIRPELPRDLDRFFDIALAFDAAQRFASAEALAEAFAAIAAGRPLADVGSTTARALVPSSGRARLPQDTKIAAPGALADTTPSARLADTGTVGVVSAKSSRPTRARTWLSRVALGTMLAVAGWTIGRVDSGDPAPSLAAAFPTARALSGAASAPSTEPPREAARASNDLPQERKHRDAVSNDKPSTRRPPRTSPKPSAPPEPDARPATSAPAHPATPPSSSKDVVFGI